MASSATRNLEYMLVAVYGYCVIAKMINVALLLYPVLGLAL